MNTAAGTTVVIPMPITRKPEPAKRPMPKWSDKRRAKFMRTVRRKAKEKQKALRWQGSRGGKAIARPRAAYAARRAAKGGLGGRIGPIAEATGRRTDRSAGVERLDAIAYLRAATEGYEGVPTSVCLSLLALRRLLGEIK